MVSNLLVPAFQSTRAPASSADAFPFVNVDVDDPDWRASVGFAEPGGADVRAHAGHDVLPEALLQLVGDLSHALLRHAEAGPQLAERRRLLGGQVLAPDHPLPLVAERVQELVHEAMKRVRHL